MFVVKTACGGRPIATHPLWTLVRQSEMRIKLTVSHVLVAALTFAAVTEVPLLLLPSVMLENVQVLG